MSLLHEGYNIVIRDDLTYLIQEIFIVLLFYAKRTVEVAPRPKARILESVAQPAKQESCMFQCTTTSAVGKSAACVTHAMEHGKLQNSY